MTLPDLEVRIEVYSLLFVTSVAAGAAIILIGLALSCLAAKDGK